MFDKQLDKYQPYAWVAFRVIVGTTFLLHGLMKFGVFEGKFAPPGMPLFLAAGILEVVIGPLLILGLFTRYAALIGALEMLVAFFYAHVMGKGTLNPLANGGEAAVLHFAAFIALATFGAGMWSCDSKMHKKHHK